MNANLLRFGLVFFHLTMVRRCDYKKPGNEHKYGSQIFWFHMSFAQVPQMLFEHVF